MRRIIDYVQPFPRITNQEQLPAGTGCRLLLAIESPYENEFAAVRWLRKMPTDTPRCHVVIRF